MTQLNREREIPRMAEDANDKIRYGDNIYGGAVYVGRRTGAHLDATKAELEKRHPGSQLAVIQGAFNTGVSASAGTHDYDACLDVYIPGWDWGDAQKFLRQNGWAAWWRYPPSFGNHIHMISLGCTGRVGIYVPGQIADYYAHKTGLVGHYSDNSWHPSDIKATIFDYAHYSKEDDMPTVKDILDAKLGSETTVKDALLAILALQRAFGNYRANDRERDTALAADIEKILEGSKDDATKESLRNVKHRLLEAIGEKDTEVVAP